MQWITDKLPDRGKDVIAQDKHGNEHYVFLSPIDNEWKCSLTGDEELIAVVKWRYYSLGENDESEKGGASGEQGVI